MKTLLAGGAGGQLAITGAGVGSQSLELGIAAPVVEQKKSEAFALEALALAAPTIGMLARRIIQPVAGEGEAAMQFGQQVIAGIVVAVESEIDPGVRCPWSALRNALRLQDENNLQRH